MTAVVKPVIAGNWKMHYGPTEARAFVARFVAVWSPRGDRTILIFPPAVSLSVAREQIRERPDLRLGVQNIHWEDHGAFTGEVSARMARDAGAEFALVGHSERRHVFGETDEDVAQKVRAARRAGLTPVLCIGETLEERRAGGVEEAILRQLDAVLAADGWANGFELLIAYEPVWAIGTGETATPEDATAAHRTLRRRLAERFGERAAAETPILYGGSVKPDNAAGLLAAPDVDGALVGGASLDPESFALIASAV